MLTKYENGAEVDITTVARYDSTAGAEIDAEGVYKYDSSVGAEVEVWTSGSYLRLLSKEYVTNSKVDVYENSVGDVGLVLYTTEGEDATYLTVFAEGDFVSPVITFSYNGGASYYDASGNEGFLSSCGGVYLYVREKETGKETFWCYTSSAGTTYGYTGKEDYEYDRFTGEYDRVGYRINLKSKSSYYATNCPPFYQFIDMYNFMIDGVLYKPHESLDGI